MHYFSDFRFSTGLKSSFIFCKLRFSTQRIFGCEGKLLFLKAAYRIILNSHFSNDSSIVILKLNGSAVGLPCNPGGGSPSLFIACSRITGSIFIMPHCHYYRFCGLASTKPKSDSSDVRRRVDRSSTKSPTKETSAALPISYLSALNIFTPILPLYFRLTNLLNTLFFSLGRTIYV